ncbi:hypothetical protein ASD79_08825 [Caulobacter sp. Root655]|nr:hypothetical protein ASD79_08825 [Caulobacter sp. Root655]
MTKIRILLASMPTMLTDIIDDLVSEQSDMLVVAKAPTTDDWIGAARRAAADVVIVRKSHSRQSVDPISDVTALGRLRILAIDDGGRTGSLYRLHPERVALGELSGERLVAAVRAAAREAD